MPKREECVGVGIMRLIAANASAQIRAYMQRLHREAVLGEQRFRFHQAQRVHVVSAHRTRYVFGHFVHLEESHADSMPRYAAEFADGAFQSRWREMLQQIVRKANVKRLVRRGDFKNVADAEASVWKHS